VTKIVLTIESDALTLSRVLAAIGTSVDVTPEIIPSPVVLAASLPPAVVGQTTVVTTQLPPPMPTGDAVEVDAAGAVWDPAIHSSNRQKKADGTWRVRRGVGDVGVAPPLEAYQPVESQPMNITSVMQGAPEAVALAQLPPSGPVVGVPPMPIGDAPVVPAAPVEVKTMAQFMAVFVAATKVAAGRGTPVVMPEFFARIGAQIGLELKGPVDVNQHDDGMKELIFQTGVELLKQDGYL
jgi:hypothetical protein